MIWVHMHVKASLASARGYWLELGFGEPLWEMYQLGIRHCSHDMFNDHSNVVRRWAFLSKIIIGGSFMTLTNFVLGDRIR